jgi:ferredoxin/flavodoxin---NADP+ reductase
MPDALRVAIVGAGPSGLYATEALTSQQDIAVQVDVLDKLPVPFGLVRYGVAPDHFSIRSVREKLAEVFHHPQVTFKGNIEIGADVTLSDLQAAYDAIILTYGASTDRTLEIPGERLPGSIPATDFVAWYCGHPDIEPDTFTELLSSSTSVVVVGVGNVAIDVTRILAKSVDELSDTDIPQHVLDALAQSAIRDIHLIGRRGPAHAAFTTKELRELGELEIAQVIVDPADLDLDPESMGMLEGNKVAARNVEVMHEWAQRDVDQRPRRIHLKFWTRPVEVIGESQVTAVVTERTALDDAGRVIGSGEYAEIPAQAIIRSVGYRGVGLPDIPFDAARAIIPNRDGRVLQGDEPLVGLYVAGWIKRGPTGIIGTNKKDAAATVASLLADVQSGAIVPSGKSGVSTDEQVTLQGWLAIDAAERELGANFGRARTTIHDRADLLSLANQGSVRSPAST